MKEQEGQIDDSFMPADPDHVRREKARARELKRTPWWKNVLGHGRCHYCKNMFHPSQLTMDHIVPIVRGGKSTKRNVVPCCKECNTGKGYFLPCEWSNYLNKIQHPN